MKILLIDDDEIYLYTLHRFFQSHKYEVFSAENGKDALIIVKKEKPDLIITDIKMPEMSGIELVEYLQREENTVPVILISGLNQKTMQRMIFKLGPVDFFIKPFDFNELLKLVEKIQHNGNYKRISVGD